MANKGPKGNLRGHGPSLGRRGNFRRASNLVLTGAYGRPSWPAAALPEQRVALPRAATKHVAKADERLRAKGGAAYLDKGRKARRTAA